MISLRTPLHLVPYSLIFEKNAVHRYLLLLLTCCLVRFSLVAQSPAWQQEVHYTIDVSLHDAEHTLNGHLKLQYINHSPDTLSFIWFHLWPNAYKNDKTAFSDQLLQNGRTDFYFSGKEQRGYINRLDFRTGNQPLRTEDHPQFIDVVKVWLPAPLAPGQQTTITTPFHVKLPDNFSRGGHTGHSYQVTQWYPKPAVYDRFGWHPMPYLDQGETYSEFGSFDVRITVPEDYIVAATGELTGSITRQDIRKKNTVMIDAEIKAANTPLKKKFPAKVTPKAQKKPVVTAPPPPAPRVVATRTLQYKQDRVHDFAWFADKRFNVLHDTIQLPSGRTVEAYTYYTTTESEAWKGSIAMIKDAIRFRSNLIGEYPYNVVSVVEAKMGFEGGMEYPTITSISPTEDPKSLDQVIGHEVGHNWFYGVLASNERDHPWMDEGLNSYYDERYEDWKYPPNEKPTWIEKRLPRNEGAFLVSALTAIKKDQPINTRSSAFTNLNYHVISYYKTNEWLKEIEQTMGRRAFDSSMRDYYRRWQFKHPAPEDFRQVLQANTTQDLSPHFAKLDQTGELTPFKGRTTIKPAFLYSLEGYDSVRRVYWTPAIGYNMYDKGMLGLLVHNYSQPATKFQFALAPLYSTASKDLVGIGHLGYSWYPNSGLQKIQLGVGGARFHTLDGVDSNGNKVFGGFHKIVPSLRVTFRNRFPRSTVEKWLEWKTWFIGEKGFRYNLKQQDSLYYPEEAGITNRYLNQLTFNITDYRALYPYDVEVQVQQGEGFYRATATANYFLNYARGGGMKVRVFAAKFGYLGEKTVQKQFTTAVYQPKLTAVRGNEDYTYSNYFIGRNEIDGVASQQIMMRDGGLKLRTDLFQDLQGRSDDWVASMNFNTTLPEKLFPVKLPIRIFFDVGTYAQAWKKNNTTSKFLYVGGLQVSLFKDLLNVYAPLVYSKEFRDNLKTVPEEDKFFKRLSFSFDIQRFNLRKMTRNQFPF